ncbi:restriction endonuclease subunit S, partial [Candidatus Saccharibacteria bacterium]|nr:restriction endonuclease subunit S [Candidatus Saccharibacteria bacterium]
RGNGIKRDETVSTGKPCVRYGEMYTTYRVKFSDIKSHTTSNIFDKCQKFHKDDILMALTGENKWDIALAAVYQGDEEVALGGDMCRFSPFESNSLYLVYLINSPYGIGYKRETSTGDIIVHTSVGKLGNFLVPLPPLAEQKRIVAKLEQVLPLAEEYGAAQEQLDKLNKELPEALKKSILQEAIQGKLVPQNPKDEPASILLAKIRKEKEALVKQGKLKKKDLETTPIDDEEIPFEIPDSWTWCRLGSICDYLHRGKSPVYSDKKILPVMAQKCNQWDKIYTEKCLFADPKTIEKYTTEQYLQVGDVIINSTGGGTVGRTGFVDEYVFSEYDKFVADSHVTVVRSNKNVNPKYVYYFLITPLIQRGIEERCSGSTNQIELGTETVKNYLFPLPPLAEQKRIVAKLEQLFKLL